MPERSEIVLDDKDNVPAAAPVTTVRTTFRDEFLPAEGDTSMSPIAGSNVNIRLVGETEHPYSALASHSTIEQYFLFFLSWKRTVPETRAKRV